MLWPPPLQSVGYSPTDPIPQVHHQLLQPSPRCLSMTLEVLYTKHKTHKKTQTGTPSFPHLRVQLLVKYSMAVVVHITFIIKPHSAHLVAAAQWPLAAGLLAASWWCGVVYATSHHTTSHQTWGVKVLR